MKVFIVDALVKLLSGVKINKISDKEVKTILIKDYLNLKQIIQKVQNTKEELENKFRLDWKDELPEIISLRKDNKPIEGHDTFLEAEQDTIKLIDEIYMEEVEVKITPVDIDKFIAAVDEDTLTLESISFLQENGVIV